MKRVLLIVVIVVVIVASLRVAVLRIVSHKSPSQTMNRHLNAAVNATMTRGINGTIRKHVIDKPDVRAAQIGRVIVEFEHLRELLTGPALTDAMTEEQKAERLMCFNAYANPTIMSETGSPYDSPALRSLTNSLLSEHEIAMICDATPDLNRLIGIAAEFANGDGKLRDVPAARRMLAYARDKAKESGVVGVYLSATRVLAENLALPIYQPRDLMQARSMFSEIVDTCRAADAAVLGVPDTSYELEYDWALAGLAYCHEQLNDRELAEAAYSWRLTKAGTDKHKKECAEIANDFFRVINRARSVTDPSHDDLSQWARELGANAQRFRSSFGDIQSPLLTKIEGQASNFRHRAEKLARANPIVPGGRTVRPLGSFHVTP